MVKIKFVNGEVKRLENYSKEGQYYDGKSLTVLERMGVRKKKKFDNTGIFVGDVGVGKTTMAFAWLDYMLKGKMAIENIGVGAEDSIKKISKVKDGTGIIVDDASTIFMGSDHAAKFQKQGIKILHLCRSKKLTILLTTPDLFKLNSYLVTQRVRFVVKVYTNDNLDRGFFAFWGHKKIRHLYEQGKKFNNNFPPRVRPDFIGKFTDFIPVFNDEYEKLKRKAMDELFKEDTSDYTLKELKPIYMKLLERIPNMEKPIQYKQFSDLVGISKSSVTKYRQEIAKKSQKTQEKS